MCEGLRGEKSGVKEKAKGEGAYSLHHSGWDLGPDSSQLAATTGSHDDCNNQCENQKERETERGRDAAHQCVFLFRAELRHSTGGCSHTHAECRAHLSD